MAYGTGYGAGYGSGYGRSGVAEDTTPDPFLLAQRNNMPPSTLIQSAPFTVQGINAASPWTIGAGGRVSINGGAFGDAGGTVENGDIVIVDLESSADPSGVASVDLTIGGVVGTFMLVTRSDAVVTAFPQKGGGVSPPRNASPVEWAWFNARQKNRARRRAQAG
jgi:hypothetical protein